MNPDVRLLALRLLLDGCTLRLNTARKGWDEADGAGYQPFSPTLDQWEWNGAAATLKHDFVFGDGDLTIYSYRLERDDPYTKELRVLAQGIIDGAPARVKVKNSRIEIRGVTVKLEG